MGEGQGSQTGDCSRSLPGPLPAGCPGAFGWTSWARGIGSASTSALPPRLQRPCAAGGFLGTQGCAWELPAPLGADGQEDRGGSPTPASATQQAARRGGAPSAARIGSAAQVAGRGPRQGNRKEVKISGSSILCHEGWAGVPGPSPGGVSPPGVGRGGCSLADGFGSGTGGGWQPGSGSEESLDLLRPLHVVRPRLLARQGLDEVLQASPEAHLLQGVVEPACGDAEVGLVR